MPDKPAGRDDVLLGRGRPVLVLAPMAGITNRAFRRLCRELAGGGPAAGIYVSEMVTSRGLLEGNADTLDMIRFDPDESPRSLQLYGVDPDVVAAAVRLVVDRDLADHVDLNFGCPVPKVTRKGGGSALPWKSELFARVVGGAVAASRGRIPISVKMRMGIDATHLTYLDAGTAAAQEGAAWVALHARTAEQMYSGQADWTAITQLREALAASGTPVLGNGDIWTGGDATRMIALTGCAGVVVGRGCLGRPWLLAQLAAQLHGGAPVADPGAGQVTSILRRHAGLLVTMHGDELTGCRDIRKHMAWYLKGFRVPQPVRAGLGLVSSLAELDDLLRRIDPAQPYPCEVAAAPRGRTSGQRGVALPAGWLESRETPAGMDLRAAEIDAGGG